MRKKDFLALLPKLSKKDLKEVKAAVDFLLQGEIVTVKRSPFETQAFEGMRVTLGNLGIKLQRDGLDKPGNAYR